MDAPLSMLKKVIASKPPVVPLAIGTGALLMAGAGFLLANNFLNGENAGTAASKYVSISEFYGKTKETNEEFYVYGKVSQLADGSTSFTLVDGNNNLTIQTDAMSTQTGGTLPKADTSKIANDQYVLVKGITSDDGYSLLAQDVKPITEDEFNTYKSFKIPRLAMTITNIPGELKHGCDNLPIEVKLKIPVRSLLITLL